jgi:hypothetical protein
LLAAAAVIARTGYENPNVYDEGLVVVGAMRLLAGEVPLRDFWTLYPPGVFLLFAGVFRVFGATLFVERTASVLLAAGLVAVCFGTTARRAGTLWGAFVAALVTLWAQAGKLHASPSVPALLLLFAAVRSLAPAAGRAGARRAAGAGLAIALAATFRHDFAAYAFVATLAACLACRVGRPPAAGPPLGALAIYAAVAAGTVALATGAIAAVTGIEPLVDQLIRFPITVFPEYRELPYPSGILAWGPATLGLAAAAVAVAHLRAGARALGLELLLLSATGLALISQSVVRSDFFHVLPSFVFTLTAFGMACGTAGRVFRFRTAAVMRPAAVIVALLAAWSLPPFEAPAVHRYALPAARRILSSADPSSYQRAIALVERLTPPGVPIFVGNARHDRILNNDALFYFLANRPSATRYHELHPGLATTEAVQREILDEIEGRRVATVVIRTERHPPETGNSSSRSSGVTLLDRYLRANFEPVARFGDYEIRRRR